MASLPVYMVRADGKIAAKGIHSGGTVGGSGNNFFPCLELFTDIRTAFMYFPGWLKTLGVAVPGSFWSWPRRRWPPRPPFLSFSSWPRVNINRRSRVTDVRMIHGAWLLPPLSPSLVTSVE